jgi:hypothetical protein
MKLMWAHLQTTGAGGPAAMTQHALHEGMGDNLDLLLSRRLQHRLVD